MLRIWGRRSSFNVQKVLWLAAELGLSYEHAPVGGDFGGLDTAEFRTLNPHGRIPVLQDGDLAVWESHAILRYLAARYGRGRFWSDDPGDRAPVDGWMDWAQTALQPAFLGGVFWGYYRTPEAERDWPAIRSSLAATTGLFRLLDGVLSNRPFLAGDRLTLADITAGANLYRYFELEIERPPLPNLEGWYSRLQARSAYRDHVMVPFDALKGQRGNAGR
jgi:glutathione S-transferase